MLSPAEALWPRLTAKRTRWTTVVEIVTTTGTTLRYADQKGLTWGGNAYTPAIVKNGIGKIRYEKELRIPSVKVTFANPTNLLRTYLEPTDVLTGGTIRVRALFRDTSDVLDTDSIVLFEGWIEPPTRVSEAEFDLTGVAWLDGAGMMLPRRRTSPRCQWQFANAGAYDGGGHCSYNSTTTTTASDGGSATVNVPVAERIKLTTGSSIFVGSPGATVVTVVSGGGVAGAGTVVVSAAITFANGAAVRFSTCSRERSDCEQRAMYGIRFGGFPGSSDLARALAQSDLSQFGRVFDTAIYAAISKGLREGTLNVAPSIFASAPQAVPVLYGRRRIPTRAIESQVAYASGHIDKAVHYAISDGEIDGVEYWWIDDKPGAQVTDGTYLQTGLRVRKGTVGLDDDETLAEYLADETAFYLSQNRDLFSDQDTPYSETGYATFVEAKTAEAGQINTLVVDAKGVKCQKYTAGRATDGAKAWSENPLWTALDLSMSDKHGAGLAAAKFDFAVIKPEADYCDPAIASTEASTTITASVTSATHTVASTDGFTNGRTVKVNGVDKTLKRVVSSTQLEFSTSFAATAGQTVIQQPPRFAVGLLIDGAARLEQWVGKLLRACRGYVTYNEGKIQFRVERATVAERLADGGMENWASATNLTSWTEAVSLGNTVNREASVVRSGTYSARLDCADQGGGLSITNSFTGLEPGRWYRITVYARATAADSNGARIVFRNNTASRDLRPDGTWDAGIGVNLMTSAVGTDWALYEFTFLTDPSFAITDTYHLILIGNFMTAGQSIYYDDASIRGPYAGDFRESGYANAMAIVGANEPPDSFRWSIDRKDRETNRVAVRFQNESGFIGSDEAVAEDFTHQLTRPVKTLTVDGEAILDRDQASRIGAWELARRRTLLAGCEFTSGAVALVIQPGDVILVTHTVPGWTCEEQRVIEVEIDPNDGLVTLKTEDYQEAIYTDVGVVARRTAQAARPGITPTLKRQSARTIRIGWDVDASLYGLVRYEVHRATSASFTPSPATLVGSTRGVELVYNVRNDEIGALLYWKVVAITFDGEIQSSETSGSVLHNVADDLDPTAFEGSSPFNLGYGGDFDDATQALGSSVNGDQGWITDVAMTYGADVDPGSNAADARQADGGFANPTNVTDENDATRSIGSLSVTGVGDTDSKGHVWYNFGASATKTARFKVKLLKSGTSYVFMSVKIWTTPDATAGTPVWTLDRTITNTTLTEFETAPVTGDISKMGVAVTADLAAGSGGAARSAACEVAEVNYNEITSTTEGTISGGKATIKGDGATNYGNAKRRFPGKAPVEGATIFKGSGSKAVGYIRLRKKNSGDTLDSNPVLLQLWDENTDTYTTVLSVPSASITASWKSFTFLFQPASNINGRMWWVVRSLQSKQIEVARVAINRGSVIVPFELSVEEIVAGKSVDQSEGVDGPFTQGAWGANPKEAAVA